jgi:hypothetical protein
LSKARELWQEFRSVLGTRALDALLPPMLFLVVNAIWGFRLGTLTALGAALAVGLLRLLRRERVGYALGGLASVMLAMGLVWVLGRAESFFLPDLITGGATLAFCTLSLAFGRPLTAWTSHFARGWPREWYWHHRVRPAYSETTLLWTAFFAVRLWCQVRLYLSAQTDALVLTNTLSGWPALIVLLIFTYLYGTWRLRRLAGPSVEEFQAGTPPPWEGQRRGF